MACFVLPSGTTGLQASAAAGLFVPDIRLGVFAMTMLQSTDATGRRALGRVDGFLKDIREALSSLPRQRRLACLSWSQSVQFRKSAERWPF
ncbi:hypothetical protein [Pelagimonas varians]|uniref:hypothetical protein n=1 Tax=Pelagimonas varians TaxID=696760 RepID=UPI000BEF13F0|nr:hypothetical protein [Pelagimonas varians]PYG27843.1 hypothetical protein C8N36_114119 [Pelagimonas varians]